MTGHITDHLRRLGRPRSLTVVNRVVTYLGMLYSTYNAELNTLLTTRQTCQESPLFVIIEGTTKSVAHLVTEGSNARHTMRISLHSQRVLRKLGSLGSPSLSVDNDGRINGCQCSTYFVHGLYVVNTHKIKSETVYVVFVHPV